jgi:hypothetical protein
MGSIYRLSAPVSPASQRFWLETFGTSSTATRMPHGVSDHGRVNPP